MGDDENFGFHTIVAFIGWDEESWPLIRTQLDTQVHQQPQLFSNLFYDTVFTFRNVLQVEHLDVQDIDNGLPYYL